MDNSVCDTAKQATKTLTWPISPQLQARELTAVSTRQDGMSQAFDGYLQVVVLMLEDPSLPPVEG